MTLCMLNREKVQHLFVLRLKDIINGGVVETTFRPTETFERSITLRERKCSICTMMESLYYFMDNETFDQIADQRLKMSEIL